MIARLASLVLIVACFVCAAPAHAQTSDALAAAREKAARGEALYAEERWAEAAETLEAAARAMVAEQGAQVPESLALLILYIRALENAERFADALMMASQMKQHAAAAQRFNTFLDLAEQEARLQWVLGDPAAALETYQLILPFAEGRPEAYADRIEGYRLLEAVMLVDLSRFAEAGPRLATLRRSDVEPIARAADAVYAKMLADQGDHDEALQVYAGVTGAFEASQDTPAEVLAETLSSLGATLIEAGRPEEADALAVRVLSDLAAAGQGRSWAAGEALRLRAAAAQYAGRPDLVAASISQSAEILSERLGPRHPQTLLVRADLAVVMAETGDFEGAQALAREVLTDASPGAETDGAAFAALRATIAAAALASGDARTAVMLFAASQDRFNAILGPAHPDTIAVRLQLANILLTPARPAPRDALGLLRDVTQRVGVETQGERRRRALTGVPAPGYLHVEAAWAVANGG
ncbi:MAG: hypothetical protein RIA71_14160 [Oceanicaulis sp.]